jgi:hypothetical protein
VPALERLRGVRVVADPAALDGARWSGDDVSILRFAPDEAFGIGATRVEVADEHAITVDERGFVGARCSLADLANHIDWTLPAEGPRLHQGAVAGVPAKIWIGADIDHILLVTAAPYADELSGRLGWPL